MLADLFVSTFLAVQPSRVKSLESPRYNKYSVSITCLPCTYRIFRQYLQSDSCLVVLEDGA